MKDTLSFMPEGVPSLGMRRISCPLRLCLVPEMGQKDLIFHICDTMITRGKFFVNRLDQCYRGC